MLDQRGLQGRKLTQYQDDHSGRAKAKEGVRLYKTLPIADITTAALIPENHSEMAYEAQYSLNLIRYQSAIEAVHILSAAVVSDKTLVRNAITLLRLSEPYDNSYGNCNEAL